MSKPFSIRTQPWASFDKQSYSIFTDDFVHEKLITIKVNQKPLGGTINLKNVIAKKGDQYKSSGEIKLWFPVWKTRSGHFYFRSKSDGFKLHYDDGLKEIANSTLSYYNLYASYQSQKNFKNPVIKTGVNLIAKNWSLDNRLRIHVKQSNESEYSAGFKFAWAKDNWSFDFYDIVGLKTLSFIKNAVRVGYKLDGNQFYLRGENDAVRQLNKFKFGNLESYFTNFTFDYVRRIDDLTKFGIETQFTPKALGKSSVVLQRSIPDRKVGVKAKLSSDKSVAFCYQAVIQDYGKWTAGVEVSELGTTNKSRYGVQLEINL